MITKYRIYLENSMGIGNKYKVGDIVDCEFIVGKIILIGLNYVDVSGPSGDSGDVWTFGIGYIKPATAEEIEQYHAEVAAKKYNL